MRPLIPALCAALALFSPEARTSEFADEIPLAEVVRRSDHVVVVVPAAPPRREVVVPLTAQDPSGASRDLEPFVHHLGRWKVTEVLFAAPPEPELPPEVLARLGEAPKKVPPPPKVGDVLEVEGDDVPTRLEVHRREALDGTRKLPIYQRYTTRHAARPDDRSAVILFLQAREDRLADVGGATEGLAGRPQVLEALKAREVVGLRTRFVRDSLDARKRR
jgi:hypothetical protein